ncbi:MAG: hypothetical protein FJW90_04285 [Actinobacteria bacterium]|nr:hypothetical protein [Actinomycetota bacterium]
MVHDAAQAERLSAARTSRAGRALIAPALVLGALLLGACGGGGTPAQQGVGGGTALRLADCDDWNGSGVEERLNTVKQLREFAGGPIGNIAARGAILDDDQAYDLLVSQCEPEFSGAFRLYKLYVRAAAFIGH